MSDGDALPTVTPQAGEGSRDEEENVELLEVMPIFPIFSFISFFCGETSVLGEFDHFL